MQAPVHGMRKISLRLNKAGRFSRPALLYMKTRDGPAYPLDEGAIFSVCS
jgi:hypothetical protein